MGFEPDGLLRGLISPEALNALRSFRKLGEAVYFSIEFHCYILRKFPQDHAYEIVKAVWKFSHIKIYENIIWNTLVSQTYIFTHVRIRKHRKKNFSIPVSEIMLLYAKVCLSISNRGDRTGEVGTPSAPPLTSRPAGLRRTRPYSPPSAVQRLKRGQKRGAEQ